MNFRKLLLNRCQKEFEKDQDDDEIFERKQKELEAAKDVRNIYCHCPNHRCFCFMSIILLNPLSTNTHLSLPSARGT